MEKKKEFIINMLFWAVIGALLYIVFKFLFPALIPFIIGFLVACLVRFFAKKIGGKSDKARKYIAIGIIVAIYAVLFTAMILISVNFANKIGDFIQSLPSIYSNSFMPMLELVLTKIEDIAMQFDVVVARAIQDALNDLQSSIGTYIFDISQAAVGFISDSVISIPSFLIKLIVTVVSTFFIAVDFEKITELLRKVIGAKKYGMLKEGVFHTKTVLSAYLKSYTLLFCLTFIELCIGFCILGIPYPTLIALCIAIFDILPILGTGGVLIPWALICIFIGKTPFGIGIFVLYLIITAIRNTIEPKIVGQQIGLHPLATLMAMFVGMNMFGLAGLIFFPVTLVIIVSMVKGGAIKFPENKEN